MAIQVQQPGNPAFQGNYSFSADSSLLKALTAIPLLGNIPHIIAVNSLRNDVALTVGLDDAPERLAEILKIDNEYKTAGTVRLVLTLAALVVGVATGLFQQCLLLHSLVLISHLILL